MKLAHNNSMVNIIFSLILLIQQRRHREIEMTGPRSQWQVELEFREASGQSPVLTTRCSKVPQGRKWTQVLTPFSFYLFFSSIFLNLLKLNNVYSSYLNSHLSLPLFFLSWQRLFMGRSNACKSHLSTWGCAGGVGLTDCLQSEDGKIWR